VTEESLGERHGLTSAALTQAFLDDAIELYDRREQELGPEVLRDLERRVLLSIIDNKWREHLYEMDYLLEGINLRAMGQQDPLVAYTNDGFEMFREMEASVREEFVRYMFHIQILREEKRPRRLRTVQGGRSALPSGGSALSQARGEEEPDAIEQARSDKVPRNAPCPCGSGKKYKFCHAR
jgi:preprotein translocase subunit SecA